jgi:thioredoxin 1
MSKDREIVVELNKDNYEATVSSGGIVLVDCWAAWCKACKDFQPVFERAARRHPGHRFGKLNTLLEDEIVASLGIEQIPSLVLFRDGLMLFNQPGYFDDGGLDDIVAQAESLDMDEVRSAIEAEQAAEQQAG